VNARRVVVALAMLGAAGLPTVAATPCLAVGSGDNAARIVIEAAGDSATFCVAFAEDAITGFEALRRTGVPVIAQDHGAGQVTICRIGGIGCEHPRNPCFCECVGTGACAFWGYYRAHRDGAWRFSEVGAGATEVRDGDVEGWRYGAQTSTGGNAPRARSGACVREARFLAVAASSDGGSAAATAAGIAALLAASAAVTLIARRRARRA
jgi:hypothetical protein